MKIALTGATGYLGWFLVRRLLEAGHEIRALVRDPAAADLPAGVERIAGGLSPDEDYSAFLAGADALVHSGHAHVAGRFRKGEGDDLAGYLRANVGGSLALMRQAVAAGVGRCVFLSSRAAYGAREPGATLSEDMALRPDTHYGAAKAAVEAFAFSFARQEGWPACTIRPTGVYGVVEPFARTKWLAMVRDLLAGRPIAARVGGEVHGRDVAAAIGLLLEAPADRIAGRAFNCSDLFVTNRRIAELVGEAAGRAVPLPEAGNEAAYNRMDNAALAALGMRFSGEAALTQCLGEMVARIEAGEGA